jgi:hypothetical protein
MLTRTDKPTPDAVRIDKSDPAGDDARGFELLDAFPAGRGRKSDALRHLRDRQRGVLLQDLQK